ncbi:MAG: sensor histidine kinase [Oscillospiraceae bacterium]
MKLFRSPRSMTALAWMVSAAFFLTWLASMVAVTWRAALYYLDYYQDKSGIYCSAMTLRGLGLAEGSSYPNSVENEIWDTLRYGNNRAYSVRAYNGDTYFLSDNSIDWQTATAVYDGGGNRIACSGDFIFFPYDTEQDWETADADTVMNRSGYTKVDVDMDALEKTKLEQFDKNDSWDKIVTFDMKAMRFTGVFDGAEFHADQIEYILDAEFHDALYSREPDIHYFDEDGSEVTGYNYSYSEVIRTENIPWHTLYDSGKHTEGAVTIYTTMPSISDYDEGKALTFQGTEYDSLLSLLLSRGISDNSRQISTGSVTNLIVLEQSCIYDYDDLTETEDGGKIPATKYIITTAVHCSPLRSALYDLKGLYLVTFLIAAGLALAVSLTLRRRLILPIDQVNTEIAHDFEWTPPAGTDLGTWREVQELYQHYTDIQYKLRDNRIEITRLNTALEYAKDAEQNRRQMTSNIAHELKTPLAVIHSYAEGLKEHIAEGKREKYIDVILSESERLDDMVLELLDLSRLEAGKVKLSVEEFSLSGLTRGVFERLEMAAQAKDLRIEYDFPEDCTVTADEGRIRQVVENFATNAVKYTPAGGTVRVRITVQHYSTSARTDTTFSIENDSAPLSDEALSKVWDTFYRADGSRSGGGTGLGLAIAKNIVELHGGRCSVRNTKTGVEFRFTI